MFLFPRSFFGNSLDRAHQRIRCRLKCSEPSSHNVENRHHVSALQRGRPCLGPTPGSLGLVLDKRLRGMSMTADFSRLQPRILECEF